MIPCETSIVDEQDAGKSCKNSLYFGFSCSYLKNKLGDSNFLLHENLWSGFRATLNFQLFKVALNPLHRIFFKLCGKFNASMLVTFHK